MNKRVLIAKLTDNFSWAEANITQHRGIDNAIPFEYVANIRRVALEMEKVREILGEVPIIVSSWFRSKELNAAIGGSKTSDHMLGCAVDFIAPKFGSPLQICKRLSKSSEQIPFKQLIMEFTWVHISFEPNPDMLARREVLTFLGDGKYALGLTDSFGKRLT